MQLQRNTQRPRAGLVIIAAFGLALAGCTQLHDNFGYAPTPIELAELEIGTATKETVAEAVGVPPFDDFRREDVWYYVSHRTETYLWNAPEITNREVVAIRFSEAGTVSNIERFGLEQGEVVTISRRVTEAAVPDLSLVRQIFGGVGGVRADQVLGSGDPDF
ncbi:MAG: outer membrane protein assembly factor BamE [Mangrovicoccus sp.]